MTKRAGRFLLATNIIVLMLNGDLRLEEVIDFASEVFVPAISLGELAFGAAKSARTKENLAKLEGFVRSSRILPADFGVAKAYGSIKDGLRRIGKPIPENDVWIAATAICWNLTLVTRDAHFNNVAGLKLDDWR